MQDRVEVLKQVHEDVVAERNRLRDARAGFTSRLGPLPASAGIAIGLAAAVSDEIGDCWIVAAGIIFLVLVWVSTVYSGLTPYRVLRGREQRRRTGGDPQQPTSFAFSRGKTSLEDWLNEKITLEENVCGKLPQNQRRAWLKRRNVQTLQDAVDVERSAFYLVQGLFALIIGIVGAGIVLD